MGERRERVPEPPEAAAESCSAGCSENTDGLDLVVPSSQLCVGAVASREDVRGDGQGGKTLLVNIASGDEGEAEDNSTKAKEEDENETPRLRT